MRLLVAVITLAVGFAALQSASAASVGVQSGRGGSQSQGARAPHPALPRPGLRGTGPAGPGIPGFENPRPGFPRTGIGRPGFRAGLRGGRLYGAPLLAPIGPLYPYDIFPYGNPEPEFDLPYVSPGYAAGPVYLPSATGYEPPSTQHPGIWYYCQDPMGYYPYVQDCSAAWQIVPASVLPPPVPEQ